MQLPSKRHMQVLETSIATVGRVSNIDHNKRIIGKAGRNRWLGERLRSGLWHCKGSWAGRKIRPLPPMKRCQPAHSSSSGLTPGPGACPSMALNKISSYTHTHTHTHTQKE
ncbi:unnamed protein product [Lepidochelys kempii]